MTLRDFRQTHSLPASWKPKNLWDVVRELIRENYKLLIDEDDIRSGYYIIRDFISPMIGSEITHTEFDWFLDKQGYASYRDDIWVGLEQNEGYKRPEAKPDGWYYNRFGRKKPIEDMWSAWNQIRGWIFVEKSKEAEKMRELSYDGWAIVISGRGFPTRLVRRLLKEQDKPILIFHDADKSGKLINKVFGEGSRRTTHLNLLIEKATNIGMDWEDVLKLDLPTQPEPPKYKGEPRAEISALSVLKLRMGIENPTLEYIKIKMVQKNITIAPLEKPKVELWESLAKSTVKKMIENSMKEHLENTVYNYEIEEGEAVYGYFKGKEDERDIETSSIEEAVTNIVKELHSMIEWTYAKEIHQDNVDKINKELATLLGVELNTNSG